MDLRRVTAADIDKVAAFATEGLRPQREPLNFSPAKLRSVVRHFVDSQNDFQLAAFEGERMVGGVAAVRAEMHFFERCEAHVVFCYAVKPGAGCRLIRAMLDWAKADPMIRRVLWAFDSDYRTCRMAEHMGFNRFDTLAVCHT